MSFEILGQLLSSKIIGASHKDYWVGGGIGYYPIRNLKLFLQAGAAFIDDGDLGRDVGPDVQARGRLGMGYRFMFFLVGIMPFGYIETTTSGIFTWSIGVRLQY